MSTQNLVPRTDKSGSLGTSTKGWGTGSFHMLVNTNPASVLSGSFSGSFEGTINSLIPTSSITNFDTEISRSIASAGFGTGNGVSSYNNLTDVPVGIVSSSNQIEDLGFITSSGVPDLNGTNVVSSSNQIEDLGFISESFSTSGTGIVSQSSQISYTNITDKPTLFDGEYSSLSNIPIGIVSSSSQVDYNNIQNTPSGLYSSSVQITNLPTSSITNFDTEVSRSAVLSGFGSGGGGSVSDPNIELVSTIEVSSATGSVSFDGLDLSNYYKVDIVSTKIASSHNGGIDTLMARFNGDSTGQYNTIFFGRESDDTSVASGTDGTSQTSLRMSDVADANIADSLNKAWFRTTIYNPGSSTEMKGIETRAHVEGVTGGARSEWISGNWEANESITNIKIYSFNSKNIISGSIVHLYGYKQGTSGSASSSTSGSFSGSFEGDGSQLSGIVATVVEPNFIDFQTGSGNPSHLEGRLFYDDTAKTLSFYNDESDVTLNIGQEEVIRVYNSGSETILNGAPVRINGALNGNPTITLAQSQFHSGSENETNEIIGLATHNIETGSYGYVTSLGLVNGLDTSGFNLGDTLYVSQSAGELTNQEPPSPYDKIKVGFVTRVDASTGKIFVKTFSPVHLHEISNVSSSFTTPNKSVLTFNSSSGYWEETNELQISNGIYRISGSSSERYNTVSGALADASSGDTVFIAPGTYYEGGLDIKNGVKMLGATAYGGDVTIFNTDTGSNYTIHMTNGSVLSYVQVIGANHSNPIVTMESDINTIGAPLIQTCRILGGGNAGQVGVYVTGSGVNSLINSSFANGLGHMGDAIRFEGTSTSTLFVRDVLFAGSGSYMCNITGSGINGEGTGEVTMLSSKAFGTQADYKRGISFGASGSFEGRSVSMNSLVSESIWFDSGSDGARLELYASSMKGITNDVNVASTETGTGTTFGFSSLETRQEKFNDYSGGTWTNNVRLTGLWLDEGDFDDSGTGILGELHVGIPGKGAESSFGEGDSSTLNMYLFHSGSNGWVDNTVAGKTNGAGSFTMFSDSGSGATAYFGNSVRKFPNMKVDIEVPQTGSIPAGVWEYSSGSSWVEFNVHNTNADFPYNDNGIGMFSLVENEQLRFEDIFSSISTATWTTSSVNNQNAYWVRYRLTTDLSSSAEIDRVKIGTNRTEINKDGVVEFFGTAQPRRNLQWHQKLNYALNGSAPTDVNITYSPNITLDYIDNGFTGNARDGAGGIVDIPEGLDTSRPVQLDIYWKASANGSPSNVELELDVVPISIGDTIDGALTETSYAKIETVGTSDANVLKKTSFEIDVSLLKEGEFFALSYFRDGSGGNADDNFSGTVEIIKVDITGYFWR